MATLRAVERARPDDEGPHPGATQGLGGEESWDLTFTTADATLGGFVRLTLRPNQGRAWFWASLVGRGRPLVTVIDFEVAPPRTSNLDLRGEGLWTSFTCETPLQHWSVGLEAFGVALEDPREAWRSLRGDRTALGMDLEWETAGPVATALPDGYHLPCLVHGEILVDDEVLVLDGSGGLTHVWGPEPWDQAWSTTAGRLDDAITWYGPACGLHRDPSALVASTQVPLVVGSRLVLRSVSPLFHAPVGIMLESGPAGRLSRTLCHYRAVDDRTGTGWLDSYVPVLGSNP